MLAGQVIVGAVWSATVTVNEQVAVLPTGSVAVIVTVWFPRLKVVPAAGDCVFVAPAEQLSVAVALAV